MNYPMSQNIVKTRATPICLAALAINSSAKVRNIMQFCIFFPLFFQTSMRS